MGTGYELLMAAIAVAVVALMFLHRKQIAEAIENFRNNFPRGGPGTPMHPSPAGDERHLRRGADDRVGQRL
jgi:hypothetical protein